MITGYFSSDTIFFSKLEKAWKLPNAGAIDVPTNSTSCLESFSQNICIFKLFMTLEIRDAGIEATV